MPAVISLEDELATAGEGRRLFSVYGELRAASYIAVALVTTGVGIWIKNHPVDPVTILVALLLAAAACYAFALRRRERTIVADYVLLLGALLVSAAVGYAETQFHLLGANWSRHLLVLALFHIATAYLCDSRLVLGAGLAALAAWFGVDMKAFDNGVGFGQAALSCAATVAIFRLANRYKAFDATYEHFAANLAFFGALAWALNDDMRWIGVAAALVLAAICVIRRADEASVIYAIIYATIAFDTAVVDLLHGDALRFLYLLVSTPVAIVILFVVYRRLKEARA